MAISDNIRICRIQQNMTQKQLGDLLYVSDKTISKWESGRSIPDIYTIKKIAEILKVNYELLIDGDDYSKHDSTKKNVIFNFLMIHKTVMIISIILIAINIACLFVSAYIAYFILITTLFFYISYAFVTISKWYGISLIALLIPFMIQINSFFQFDLNYIVIILFPSTIVLIIFQLVKAFKTNNDMSIVDAIGNLAIILSVLVYISCFNIYFHESGSNIELVINGKTGFAFYIIAATLLLLLHQYLYNKSDYQDRVLRIIKSRLLIVSIGFVLLTITSVFVATSINLAIDHIKLSGIYVGNSYYDENYSTDQIESIKEIYGEDNVTIARYAEVTTELQIYAYTSNFINNGVMVDPYLGSTHIENISLLYGETWDVGSQEKVIVVDEDTAMNAFDRVNVIGEYILINQEEWEIIGVVTNTTASQTYLERAISNGVNPDEVQLDSYAYIPYYFRDYQAFDIVDFSFDMLIIKDSQMLSSNKDAENLIDIIVDGNNYYIDNGERFTKISITTGNEVIRDYISLDMGLLLTSSLSVVFILVTELKIYMKQYKKRDKKPY